jgi:NTE family protein
MKTPDVLVLGGGGTLGEAWMSALLAGLEDSSDVAPRECRCFIGTSAGSIVAASLAAGLAPGARLGDISVGRAGAAEAVPEPPSAARQFSAAAAQLAGAAAAPLASLAFAAAAPGGALLRRAALGKVPPGRGSLARLGELIAASELAFDGRLLIVAVDAHNGHRVIFGSPGAPKISVAQAVEASCAIPGVFRPILAGGHAYVDGGVWSPTNIDAAVVSDGDRVLCLNPTGSLRPARGALGGAIGPISRGIAASEGVLLRRRGASVRIVSPDQHSSEALGTNLMDDSRRRAVIDAGLAQGRRLGARARRAA